MKRLAAALVGVLLTLGLLVGPATTTEAANTTGCRYERGGSTWWGGEWVSARCSGTYFMQPYGKHTFRAYVICDRLGSQPNVVRKGPWSYGGSVSSVGCFAIGDWVILGYGIESR